ncbi:MAG: glycosyltransferase [Gammaproteobacteria bacterium]|nr:MAG: glycosyltransferase [Gammaproteobacteria bacterium]
MATVGHRPATLTARINIALKDKQDDCNHSRESKEDLVSSGTDKIRVLCISSHLGSLTNVRPEAEWFIGLQRRGIQMTVLTEENSVYVDRMRAAGVEVVPLDIRRKFEWRVIRKIRQTLRNGGHQIMHLFTNKAITNGIVAAMGSTVKVVTYRGQTGNIKRIDPTCYLTHLNPRITRITCVAHAVRTDLIANGVSPEKLVTIYKGHDLAWYDHTEAEDLGKLGIPENAFAIALVANNRPRKGVAVLIESARHLPADSPIHFLLVGNGMTSKKISARIAAGPLADHFHLIGYRDNVLSLVAACQASVLPATKREGLPRTILESMGLGIVPVVTKTGGSPELVVDGDSGYCVEPGDPGGLAHAMQRLADDPDAARAMGARARARLAEHFNVAQGVEAHVRLYRELAAIS